MDYADRPISQLLALADAAMTRGEFTTAREVLAVVRHRAASQDTHKKLAALREKYDRLVGDPSASSTAVAASTRPPAARDSAASGRRAQAPFSARIGTALEQARKKLLDLSNRNRLVNFAPGLSGGTSTSRGIDHLRVIADLPAVWSHLVDDEDDIRILTYDEEEQEELAAGETAPPPAPPRGSASTRAVSVPPGQRQLSLFTNPPPRSGRSASGRPRVDAGVDPRTVFLSDLRKGHVVAEQAHKIASRRLDRIWRKQNLLMESTGDSALFLAFGFLEWTDTPLGGQARRNCSPLLLVHVEMGRAVPDGGGEHEYRLSKDGEVQDNPALRAKLEREHRIVLPAYDAERYPSWSDYVSDIEKALRRQPTWSVNAVPVLGFFNFAKYSMYLDLDATRWPGDQRPEAHPVAAALIERRPLYGDEEVVFPSADEVASRQVDNDLPVVLGADATQYKALMTAQAGNSLVIIGPPGTGKSQTITNLIAALIAEGKTVLFAAQKTAALEVVHENLRQVGLQHACLPIYSHQSTPKEVGQRLKASYQWRHDRPHHAPTVDHAPVYAKRLNGFRSALLTPAPDHPHAVGLIHRANALRCQVERDWGAAWDPNVLNVTIPAGNIDATWWVKREECLRAWRGLLDAMSPIWDGWNPRSVESEQVPRIHTHLREIQEALGDVHARAERIHAVLAPMTRTELDAVVMRCVAAKPPEHPLPALMTALAQRPELAGELSALAAALVARRMHLDRVSTRLAVPGSLAELLAMGRASVSTLLGLVGPATTLSQVATVCDVLGDLDLAVGEIRQLSSVQPDGLTAQGTCTWADLARVGALRDGAIGDLPRGFLPSLAAHLCGPIERIRQVDDLLTHLHDLRDLETAAAALPCSADVLPPEHAARLEAAVTPLHASGCDGWSVGVLGLAGSYLAAVAQQADALAVCDRTVLAAWGDDAAYDAVLTGIRIHLVDAVRDVDACDAAVAHSIIAGRMTLTQLGWVPGMRQRLAEHEAVAATACARCDPPCTPADPVLAQVREAWKALPQVATSSAETVGTWLSMADGLARARTRWDAALQVVQDAAVALGLPTASTVAEAGAVLGIAQELARAPLPVAAAQALPAAQASLPEGLDKLAIRLEVVQTSRARLARLVPIDEIASLEELARHRREWIGAQSEWFAFLRSGYRQSRAYLRRLLGRSPDQLGLRTLGEVEELLRSERQMAQSPLLPEIWGARWQGPSTPPATVRNLQAWLLRVRTCVDTRPDLPLERALQATTHPAIAATQGVVLEAAVEELRRALESWSHITVLPETRLDRLQVSLDSTRDRALRLSTCLRQAHVGVDVDLRAWVSELEHLPLAETKRAELARLPGLAAPATWVDYPLERLAPTTAWISAWQNGHGVMPLLASLLTPEGLGAAREVIAAAQGLDRAIAAVPTAIADMAPGRLNISGPVAGLGSRVRALAQAAQVVADLATPLPDHATLGLGVLRSVLVTGRMLADERRWVEPWSATCQHALVGSDHAAVGATLTWFRAVRGEHTPDAMVVWACTGAHVEERWAWWQTFVRAMRAAWSLWRRAADLGIVTAGETAPAADIIPWHDRLRERLGQWRSAQHNLVSHVIEGANPPLRLLTAVLDDVERALAIESEVASWDALLGTPAARVSPEVIRQHQACATGLVQAHPALRSWLLHPDVGTRHESVRAIAASLHTVQEALERTQHTMAEYGQLRDKGPSELFNARLPVGELLSVVNSLLTGIDTLLPTAQFSREESRACALGLSDQIVRMRAHRLPADGCVRSFHAAVRHQQAAACIASIPALNGFSGKTYADQVRTFGEHERSLLDNNQLTIQQQLRDRDVTAGRSSSRASTLSDLHLLNREWDKQRKRLPIRVLVERGGTAMRDLCPCWLMTPIAIAQFLPNTLPPFDVVVMDEASQLDPEDALGAILRASQSIIVGDPKQMPPSSFFESSDEEEEGEGEEDESGIKAESVLDMALSSLPQSCLQWHYRSLHQSLIAPANSFSYNNELILFPSPFRETEQFGIVHRYVPNGTFVAQRNTAEAGAVVDRLVELLLASADADDPDQTPSLGVVSMNLHQQEAIHDLLHERCRRDPTLAHLLHQQTDKRRQERLTIKNLENFQGDQRDIMILALTYGPETPGGTPKQRFTAIGGVDGHRRFNVLITRSKRRMEVFTSLRSDQVTPSSNPDALGRQHLKWFLHYCESRVLPEVGTRTGREADSPFEVEVKEVLRQAGYTVEHQVGVAGYFVDLGIVHPREATRFALGIECDGWTYHSTASARDRDVQRQHILEERGWKIHRIWSTDWFRNRGQATAQLLAAAAQACR